MKIFLCEPIHQSAYQLLEKNFIIINDINCIDQCEIIITRNLKINKELIDQCPYLELIAVHGSGYDDVDIEYAKEKNIHLFNTPGLNALSVSELIISMMLTLSRHNQEVNKKFANGYIHEVAPANYIGNEISYKTFGMIGVGEIAMKTANILHSGFHMNIVGYSRSLTKEKARELGIGYCSSIQEVMEQSDFVSIGMSLNDETYHMIDKETLSHMKKTAYLINTSRGAIIQENDLLEVLLNHQIAGAGLDVLENEPVESTHPLLQLDNVVYMPHMGGSTHEALYRVGDAVVENIIEYSQTKTCRNMIF